MNWLHWSLLSAIFAGATAILAKVGTKDIDANLATAFRTVIVLATALPLALWTNKLPIRAIPGSTWGWLTLSGIATSASWLCYFHALKVGDASRVAPVDKLSVVVAMALAALLLGETVTAMHWLGGVLILAGSLLIAWK
ncbi:MAG: EamA family transporter [Pirellulales bacterium]